MNTTLIRSQLAALAVAALFPALSAAEAIVVTGAIVGAESQQPIPMEAWVHARHAATGAWTAQALSKEGAAQFSLALPEAGRYVLTPSYAPFWYDHWDRARDGAEQEISVEAAGDAVEIESLAMIDPVRVDVRVVNAEGKAVSGAELRLSRRTPEYDGDFGALSISSRTGGSGRHTWWAKPGHEVWVSASKDSYTWTASPHFTVKGGQEVPEITLTLRKPGAISATLTGSGGRVLAHAEYVLTVRDTDGKEVHRLCAQTDAAGRLNARGILTRDAVTIELSAESDAEPYFVQTYEGPADRDVALGAVKAPGAK
ncbi:MAG: hypothetical protein HYV27_01725 [Candidatus Hydrogenedentes bacterium]|nr:hypothetical protein [Candidatus Hydrogenedentota bacterium]